MTETKTQKKQTNVVSTKKKQFKSISEANLNINTTFNNTLVSITEKGGNVVAWSSSGHAGFKGSRRSTPFAATSAIEKVLSQATLHGVKKLSVYIKGPGTGRDAVLRLLRAKRDFDVELIADVTPIPHNGPRAPKTRKA